MHDGIIETVPNEELDVSSHYLPHRPVVKLHSTTKIWPVFDASACKQRYQSLNHCLKKEPNLIEELPEIINRFRQEEIGVVSDIPKAFLQIAVNQSDRNFLRFLWIKDGKITVLRYCRVVFGLVCSPFLLAAVLELHLPKSLHILDENVNVKPICCKNTIDKLKISFYVDNCVTSMSSRDDWNFSCARLLLFRLRVDLTCEGRKVLETPQKRNAF